MNGTFDLLSVHSPDEVRQRLRQKVDVRRNPFRAWFPRDKSWVAGRVGSSRVRLWREYAFFGGGRLLLDACLLPEGEGSRLCGRYRMQRHTAVIVSVVVAAAIVFIPVTVIGGFLEGGEVRLIGTFGGLSLGVCALALFVFLRRLYRRDRQFIHQFLVHLLNAGGR